MSPRVNPDRGVWLRRIPTPDELADNPELALLHALDVALDLVPRALLATHPELADPDAPFWVRDTSQTLRKADDILPAAHRLHQLIRAYQTAVTLDRDQRLERDPEIPF